MSGYVKTLPLSDIDFLEAPTASFAETHPGQGCSPRKVEAEDGLGELVLLHHALRDCWSIPHCQVGVGHSQDAIKVCIVEGVVGFNLTQTKLLVIDDDVLNLGQAERKD